MTSLLTLAHESLHKGLTRFYPGQKRCTLSISISTSIPWRNCSCTFPTIWCDASSGRSLLASAAGSSQRLLEEALPPEEPGDDDLLYQAALAVEADAELSAEMADWEEATLADGPTAIRPKRKISD
jgi:hypothetical protein